MVPTAADVYANARQKLGDDEVSGGDLYTDAYLLGPLQEAVNTMFRALENADSPLLERKTYYMLPARQQYLDFTTAGVSAFSALLTVQAKAVTTSGSVTSITWNVPNLRWRINSTAHGRTTDERIYLYGIGDAPDGFVLNGHWPIVVIDSDNFELLGAPNRAGVGSYTADSATWVFSPSSEWSLPMRPVIGAEDIENSVSSLRESYSIQGHALNLAPSSQIRLLLLRYRMRPDQIVSTNQDLRVEGSLDVLSYLTAAIAAANKGSDGTASLMFARATGARSIAEVDERNPGGLLGDLAQNHAQSARRTVTTRRFRSGRGRGIL